MSWVIQVFSRVIQCRFIFSGKNDELTPNFPLVTYERHEIGHDDRAHVP